MAPSDGSQAGDTPLRLDELADAEALVAEAGWNQIGADWRMFLDFGTVRAVHDGGRVIATAATLPYGARFGWISMVLVAASHQRRGLATKLLRRCIDDLVADGLVPVLDATPAGREVYLALGFQDCWDYHRLTRGAATVTAAAAAPAGITIRPLATEHWPSLCAYDATAFGADRGFLLARLRGRLRPAELVAERDGRIAGFLLGRDGRTTSHLGPLVADDDAVAQALLTRALGAIGGPIYLDFADAKAALRDWLAARGFSPQRKLTRMLHRRNQRFDNAARTFAVVGPEFG